jgi:hypothetical protein
MPDSTAMASLGPMPETAISLRKRSFSSGVMKPKRVRAVSVR